MKVFLCAGMMMSVLTAGVCAELPAKQVEAAREKWGAEMAKLKAKDAEEKHPKEAILFLGSSSVRRWETIARDMAPYQPIQRGYGGAKYADLVVFAEDLVAPHLFRAVVVYVGNDVTGKETDATPGQVADWFAMVAKAARARQPGADVFCVEITPTPSRWQAQGKIEEVNAALKAVCAADPKLHFVSTKASYLNQEGKPRREYFVKDLLHQNEAGYRVWAGLIKDALAGAGITK
jgi:hypothetical protein